MRPSSPLFRLLVVAPYPCFPPWAGGKIRILALARALAAKGVAVTLLTPWHPRQRPAVPMGETVQLRQVVFPFVLHPVLLTDRPLPYAFLTSFHPGLGRMLRADLHWADVVHLEQVQLAGLLGSVPASVPVAHGSQNVEVDYVRDETREGWVRRAVCARIAHLESRLLRESAHVFSVSEADQERLAALYGRRAGDITVIPNGVGKGRPLPADDGTLLARWPEGRRYRTRLLFSGSDVTHNRLAVSFLLTRLVPARPDLGVLVQGSCAARFMSQRWPGNVHLDPSHDTFLDYAVSSVVAVNPVATGSGTNLKLLHYLSHGLPVVTTPFGLRGYEAWQDCVTVSEPEGWPELPWHMLSPPGDLSARLAPLQWDCLADRMLAAYQGVVAARRG